MKKPCPSCYVLHTPDKCPTLSVSKGRNTIVIPPPFAQNIRAVHGLGHGDTIEMYANGMNLVNVIPGWIVNPLPLPHDVTMILIRQKPPYPAKAPWLEFEIVKP